MIDLHEKGDMVWVQDYHLMVLPAFLRARLHKARIGWFLHTPFPSTEVYRMLPVREEVSLHANAIALQVCVVADS